MSAANGPESRALTAAERSAVSQLPRDATSIFLRRIVTGSFLLEEAIPGIGRRLDCEAYADDKHAYLAIFPKFEKSSLVARKKKFGTSFPGLYSLAGEPMGNQWHVGAVEVKARENIATIQGEGKGKSALLTNCAFDLKPDARFTVCNLRIKSPKGADAKFDYRVYLVFFLTYSDSFDVFTVASALEDQVVTFLTDNAKRKSLVAEPTS